MNIVIGGHYRVKSMEAMRNSPFIQVEETLYDSSVVYHVTKLSATHERSLGKIVDVTDQCIVEDGLRLYSCDKYSTNYIKHSFEERVDL